MNEFRWIMTAEGLAKHAAAEAGTTPIDLSTSQLAVGDGGGAHHEPEELLAGLVNERWRGPVNQVYQHPVQQDLVVIEAIIPADVGGWDIREAAIYDAAGDMILVGKYPLTPKPLPGSGAAKVIVIRGGMRFSNGLDAVLQIPADMVMASRDYVDVAVADLFDQLSGHVTNSNNPHGTSAVQVGAAPLNHTHGYLPLNGIAADSDKLGGKSWVQIAQGSITLAPGIAQNIQLAPAGSTNPYDWCVKGDKYVYQTEIAGPMCAYLIKSPSGNDLLRLYNGELETFNGYYSINRWQ